jgi:hypothetical protein
MELRTVRRGFVALAAALLLGLAGAAPAAAAELGWLERGLLWFSGLWSAEDAGARARPVEERAFSMSETADKGMGLDPNGTSTPPPPPGEGQ